MRDEITISCRSVDTRYTRLNLLGWAMLCPHALELLVHGSTPSSPPPYPTADEMESLHEHIKRIVMNTINSAKILRDNIISVESEYRHTLGLRVGDVVLCANSRADLVYTLKIGRDLVTLYVEVTARLHVVKPWQALLRGIALYYERRLPVWVVIVSPETIMYKLLEDEDQNEILRRARRSREDAPSPNLCSLCELAHFCPYKAV